MISIEEASRFLSSPLWLKTSQIFRHIANIFAFGDMASGQRQRWAIFFFNFNMTFLATCGFFKDAIKIKLAARGQLQKKLWAQKL